MNVLLLLPNVNCNKTTYSNLDRQSQKCMANSVYFKYIGKLSSQQSWNVNLDELDVVFAFRAEEAVAKGLDAKPLSQDEGTQPAKLEQILQHFAPFSGLQNMSSLVN